MSFVIKSIKYLLNTYIFPFSVSHALKRVMIVSLKVTGQVTEKKYPNSLIQNRIFREETDIIMRT